MFFYMQNKILRLNTRETGLSKMLSYLFSHTTCMIRQGKLFHHLDFKVGLWRVLAHDCCKRSPSCIPEIFISDFTIFFQSPCVTAACCLVQVWCILTVAAILLNNDGLVVTVEFQDSLRKPHQNYFCCDVPAQWVPVGGSFQWQAVDDYGTIGRAQM